MNISSIIDLLVALITHPVIKWVIIGLAGYIWLVQGIGFLIKRGVKLLLLAVQEKRGKI